MKTLLTIAFFATFCLSCSQLTIIDLEPQIISSSSIFTHTLETDSLALVSLYKALDGNNWDSRTDNWLNGRVRSWRGVVVERINGSPRVVSLRLDGMMLNGELPSAIGKLSALRVLGLSWNYDLKGDICEELYDLKNLKVLDISFTGITGGLSESIGNLTLLDSLNIRKPFNYYGSNPNRFDMTGPLPSSLSKAKNLRYLDLDNNKFSGELPQTWGELSALTELLISSNKLEGSIPTSYGGMKSLQIVFLNNNKLSGALPETICEMTSLKELYLNKNNLSGAIPSDIGNITTLRDLDLGYNRLSGVLPTSLTSIKRLGIVRVNDNELSGTIPSTLGSNGFMVMLGLENNNFTGSLPDIQDNPVETGVWSCTVIAYGNRFTGEVPPVIFKYKQEHARLIPQQAGYGFTNLK